MLKKWNWILFFMTILLCITIFYINFKYYAGVIGMGFFGGLLGGSLFFGVYSLIKKGKKRRFTFVNSGFIAFIIIMFVVAIPEYTYKESKELVTADYLKQNNTESVNTPLLDNKTVPSEGSSSWLLNDRLYYVGVKDDQQVTYYTVNPTQGKVLKLNEPYW